MSKLDIIAPIMCAASTIVAFHNEVYIMGIGMALATSVSLAVSISRSA